MTYKRSKLGQTELVFGLWSEFIRRSARAERQVSTCSGYDSESLWLTHRHADTHMHTHTDIQLLTGYINSSAELKTKLEW